MSLIFDREQVHLTHQINYHSPMGITCPLKGGVGWKNLFRTETGVNATPEFETVSNSAMALYNNVYLGYDLTVIHKDLTRRAKVSSAKINLMDLDVQIILSGDTSREYFLKLESPELSCVVGEIKH